jgi:hypothetical protein
MRGQIRLNAVIVAGLLGAAASDVVSAAGLQSQPLARELTAVLSDRHLDAFAAKDPEHDGQFVAALFFPGSQLLVVSARYASPPLLEQSLQAKAYRDVYTALQGAGDTSTKLFVQDIGADGLRADEKQAVDIVYDKVVNQTIFDGDPNHKVKDYGTKLADADARYSGLLRVLLAAAQSN